MAVVATETAGVVRRPNLLGALIAKAAAHTLHVDPGKGRHRLDFAVLSALVALSDRVQDASKRDRRYLGTMIAEVRSDAQALYGIPGAVDGIDQLAEILEASA